jgi:beta-glucosidase-like glycosyl hydrolase
VQISPNRPERANQIQEMADYPILIICDCETGFPPCEIPKIPLVALSACDNEEYYRVFAKGVATQAKKAGFNGTWSPVLDVLNCDGPCKVYRHMSDDPMRVAKGAEIIARVYKQYGYMSSGKHYPGGKDMAYDSHMAPVYSLSTKEQLIEHDLVPYKYLMEKGLLPSIMTSHDIFANIDPDTPGTLSPKVQGIIRELGFDGVSFTDSFAMMSILQKYGEENVLGMAIAAGNDIVLPNYRTADRDAFAMLVKNYEDGMFTEERLNEAARRVLKLHEFVGSEPECNDPFTAEDRAMFDEMAKDCITAVCDEGVSPALDPDKKHLFVVLTDNSFVEDEDMMEITSKNWYYPKRIAEKIRQQFPDAEVMYLPEFSNQYQNEKVLRTSTNYDDVVFITFCMTQAYLGTDCLTRRTENMIDSINLSGKLAAVVHFGNPFALQPLLHVKRKIFGYTMPDTQLYAIDVLDGKLPAKGTLPFKIEFK